jgi:hypothetical protein
MYGIAIVGGIAGIPGTMGGRPGYDITMKPTLNEKYQTSASSLQSIFLYTILLQTDVTAVSFLLLAG